MQGVLAIGLAKLQNIGHFEAHFFFDHPISTWFFVCADIISIRFSAKIFLEIGWAQPAQPAYQPKIYKMG